MAKKITLAFATYRDLDGVWPTVQASREFHGFGFDLLCVDNAPESCFRTKACVVAAGGKYVHRPDLSGTSAPRDHLFHLARTEWVLVVDSHVILGRGAIAALEAYADANPGSKDIVHGPMVYDNSQGIATHLTATTGAGLWGTWDEMWMTANGEPFCPRVESGIVFGFASASGHTVAPPFNHAFMLDENQSLEAGLRARGAYKAIEQDKPFPIDMHGLGLFAMRKDAWPGFNPAFRGFGGEEGYIHQKVRRCGGRVVCVPGLRWRHRFRDIENGGPAAPYPVRTDDHTRNLLIGHREVAVEATREIYKDFGSKIGRDKWEAVFKEAEKVQPVGEHRARPAPMRVLGVWYSNNAAPDALMRHSLETIRDAAAASRHDVTISTCSWKPVPGNPFRWTQANLQGATGHAAILKQMLQAIHYAVDNHPPGADPNRFDAVAFLEHDVLYPPGYFDRVGDALAAFPDAVAVSNHNYIGLNASGWLKVRERHEPMHQLAMRWEYARENHARCQAECEATGECLLEPQGDRSKWVRVPPVGVDPAVHVNHPTRFTNHGEVVFEAKSTGGANGKPWTVHPMWGRFDKWWPGEPAKYDAECATCGSGGPRAPDYESLQAWFDDAKKKASDFNRHMDLLKDLADRCEVVAEVSAWDKPALVALAASKARHVVSVCDVDKGDYVQLVRHRTAAGFSHLRADSLKAVLVNPVDLMFIDTAHRAERVLAELERYHEKVNKYLVLHCTKTFGEKGDDGGPGVLPAMREFLRRHQDWVVRDLTTDNHGLAVLSKCAEDRKPLPGMATMAWNMVKATAKDLANGQNRVPLEVAEQRLAECWTCPVRSANRCTQCGCYLDHMPNGDPGKVFYPLESCPAGKWHAVETP